MPISEGSSMLWAARIEPAPMKIRVKVPMNSATAKRGVSEDMARNLRVGPDGSRVPGLIHSLPMRRRVTYSRNLTLSLSRTCQCYCKYCAFATHQAHLHEPEEVLQILDGAARRGVKELLVLTGERPEVNPGVASRLAALGHGDFTAYVVWTCERA